VTVLGNTGNLAKTGYSFNGWNTKADGSDTACTQGQTFSMGSANVTRGTRTRIRVLRQTPLNFPGLTAGANIRDSTGRYLPFLLGNSHAGRASLKLSVPRNHNTPLCNTMKTHSNIPLAIA
jgi:hypothetical protein